MAKSTILLVEDDELDIRSVQRTLKKLQIDYTLHIAYNGKDALTMLSRVEDPVKPDIIFLDLNMPGMNGMEFLKTIRGDERFRDLKVFIMTVFAEPDDRKKAEELGISGYFIKPLSYTDNTKRSDSMDAFMQFHLRKILSN